MLKMPFEIYDILTIITAFLLLFFSVFLFSQKGEKRTGNLLLAGFLLCHAVYFIVFILLRAKPALRIKAPMIFGWIYLFDLLIGPLIYFYTRLLAFKNFRFNKQKAVHLIPAALFLAYLPMRYIYLAGTFKSNIYQSAEMFFLWEQIIFTAAFHILLVIYAFASLGVLKHYTIEIKKVFSSIEQINLSWLRFVLFSFGTIWFIVVLNALIVVTWKSQIPFFRYIMVLWVFAAVNIMVFRSLKQPQLFTKIREKPKYEKSTLTPAEAQEYLKQLNDYMKNEKPYLIPALTIENLSKKTSIPARHLSQLINDQLDKNFFDFINSYRVEEAKKYLEIAPKKRMTNLQILYEVGFNSKAAFNRAFRKHMGMSPTEFKKQYN